MEELTVNNQTASDSLEVSKCVSVIDVENSVTCGIYITNR